MIFFLKSTLRFKKNYLLRRVKLEKSCATFLCYNITEFLKIQKTLEILPIAFINFPFTLSDFSENALSTQQWILDKFKASSQYLSIFLGSTNFANVMNIRKLNRATFSCLSNGWISLVSLWLITTRYYNGMSAFYPSVLRYS